MNRTEAQEFFREHSQWLANANSWGMTPEGREYKRRFDSAVEAIMAPPEETPIRPPPPRPGKGIHVRRKV